MPAEQISLTREAIERSGTLPPTILKDLPMELKQKIFGELRSDSALKHS
jgi:hypothetical protein